MAVFLFESYQAGAGVHIRCGTSRIWAGGGAGHDEIVSDAFVGYPVEKLMTPAAMAGANKLLLHGTRHRFEAVI